MRTPGLPFVGSRASAPVSLLSACGIAVVTALPFTPLGPALGLAKLPPVYFALLASTVAAYFVLATAVKNVYVKKFGELL